MIKKKIKLNTNSQELVKLVQGVETLDGNITKNIIYYVGKLVFYSYYFILTPLLTLCKDRLFFVSANLKNYSTDFHGI